MNRKNEEDSILGAGYSEMKCQVCGYEMLLEPPVDEGTIRELTCHACEKETKHKALPHFPCVIEAKAFNKAFMPAVRDFDMDRKCAFAQEAVRRLFGLHEEEGYQKFVEMLGKPIERLW